MEALNHQEQKVFSLIFLKNKDIAKLLNMPVRQVAYRFACIFNKFGLNSGLKNERITALKIGLSLGYKIDDKVFSQIEYYLP